ncbi:MAG: MFS transporter [Pseudomonadota bacterium]
MATQRQRIWGWYAFDWASQPFFTLILTFIFAPYFVTVVGDAVEAQAQWASMLLWIGLASAVLAPIIGALADQSGYLIRWVAGLTLIYCLGSAGLWYAVPGMETLWPVLLAFAVAMIAAEMATIVTNAFLPSLGRDSEIGEISGNGFAIGYAGGFLALVIMLGFFAQGPDGRTFLGLPPAFGLDPDSYQGTRMVGPLAAFWFAVFMIPFFVFIKDPVRPGPKMSLGNAVRSAGANLKTMVKRASGRPSLIMFLTSSMFYRDALNGLYTFGGVYAAGVLGWSTVDVGVFGIIGVISAVLASWWGGKMDGRYGPKAVISVCIPLLMLVSLMIVSMGRDSVLWFELGPNSNLPDIIMYICGAVVGGAGGSLQAASRSLMVRHAEDDRPTEAFGLYAMTGKATAFLAPLLVNVATEMSGDQRIGVSPLIVLFLIGLALLPWVKRDGDT